MQHTVYIELSLPEARLVLDALDYARDLGGAFDGPEDTENTRALKSWARRALQAATKLNSAITEAES
ncbi:MAG: hypothetical protein ABIQ57_14570 [Candidatus Kapaibacterium sp.]